ncbi:hypothetical protein [Endozoicomonas numazuensis]|uniref:Uncharacterized protein n=1 Tax=Endozoicomonas numazuensis TaxID=1137799 RepID=A0A081NL71_9GAMM|nr:hypothetical protein [Endozoicomonas numazuensis]KEQ19194.1 hypothetical protein GZ78_04150 [Endozoicomonas numazuensis]
MDIYDQISLLHDAEQLFAMEALSCECDAVNTKSEKYAAIRRKRAKALQAKAQETGAWKRRLEQQAKAQLKRSVYRWCDQQLRQ